MTTGPFPSSKRLSAVRSSENISEERLRKALWRAGLRYVLYDSRLPGTPDIVFPRYRTALFVDGDFWHGREILEGREAEFVSRFKTERVDWWIKKLRRTIERDRRTNEQLVELGWRVIRVWESDLVEDFPAMVQRLKTQIIEPSGAEPL